MPTGIDRPPAAAEPITIDQSAAAKLTTLSAKTLGRLADAGESVGRVKVGRRVLYHRATLEAWLVSQTGTGGAK
jgi:excisionase family DNA binding protein